MLPSLFQTQKSKHTRLLKKLCINPRLFEAFDDSISIFDARTKQLIFANSAFYAENSINETSFPIFSSCADLLGDRVGFCQDTSSCLMQAAVTSSKPLVVNYTTPDRRTWAEIEIIFESFCDNYVLRRAKDLTQSRKTQLSLDHTTTYDQLTGLLNRTAIGRKLRQLLQDTKASSGLISVFTVDLNRFRMLNDSLGREAGDSLLRTVAERLRYGFNSNTLISRVGSDEFVIISPYLKAIEDVESELENIRDTLRVPFQVQDRREQISAAIGISLFPKDSTNAEELLLFSDLAMSASKLQDPGSVNYFTPRLREVAVNDYEFEGSLRLALENNEIALFYQPQICLKTNKILGAEALMRWNHPVHGLISPDRFVNHAEITGFVQQLDEWAVHEVCRTQRRWLDEGVEAMPIAVNISGKSLLSRRFSRMLSEALRFYRIPGKLIEIEITESVFLNDLPQVSEKLSKLRDNGLTVSIDDFGTGYSSLSYVKSLPIDKLKIDRCFIREILTSRCDHTLVDLILSLTASLGLQSIAEGVETLEQLELLREKGCSSIQGYLVSKALPLKEFEIFSLSGYWTLPTKSLPLSAN